MVDKFIVNQSGSLDSEFRSIRGREHVLASGNLLKVVSSGLVSAQVGRDTSKNCLVIILPNMEGIVNARIQSDAVSSVNHLGEAKDVGDVVRIITNFVKSGDLGFEVQSVGTSVGVHVCGPLGWVNVSNKVWVADCAVCARARVQKKDI